MYQMAKRWEQENIYEKGVGVKEAEYLKLLKDGEVTIDDSSWSMNCRNFANTNIEKPHYITECLCNVSNAYTRCSMEVTAKISDTNNVLNGFEGAKNQNEFVLAVTKYLLKDIDILSFIINTSFFMCDNVQLNLLEEYNRYEIKVCGDVIMRKNIEKSNKTKEVKLEDKKLFVVGETVRDVYENEHIIIEGDYYMKRCNAISFNGIMSLIQEETMNILRDFSLERKEKEWEELTLEEKMNLIEKFYESDECYTVYKCKTEEDAIEAVNNAREDMKQAKRAKNVYVLKHEARDLDNVTLLYMDNKITDILDNHNNDNSIFDGETMNFIEKGSYTYYDNNDGEYDVEFEVIKEDENIENTIVTVTKITSYGTL